MGAGARQRRCQLIHKMGTEGCLAGRLSGPNATSAEGPPRVWVGASPL